MTTRLTIEYDGTDFSGWAVQPGRVRTVQAELERALSVVLRRPSDLPALTVAGRTDRGVHAWAQVASYEGEPAPVTALNALLPDDVAVLESVPAADGFDARHDCTSRAYCFRILVRPARAAIDRGHALLWRRALTEDAIAALHACAALLPGTHDFTAFTPADTYHVRFDREVYAAFWRVGLAGGLSQNHNASGGLLLEFWIEADTFMRHMNRILVGTMLEVVRGRLSVDDFARLLSGRPRTEAGPTASPAGLYFAGAGYGGVRLLPTMEPGVR